MALSSALSSAMSLALSLALSLDLSMCLSSALSSATVLALSLAINRVDSALFRSSPELPSGSGEAFSWSLQWGSYRIFLFLACLCFWKLIEL